MIYIFKFRTTKDGEQTEGFIPVFATGFMDACRKIGLALRGTDSEVTGHKTEEYEAVDTNSRD